MASRRYLNFDLLLEQEGEGRYQARVTDSPLGETPSVRFQLPFDATTLENLLLKLDPGRSGTRRVGATGQQQSAMDFGGPLYDAVFTGDLALSWQRSLDRARAEDAGGLRLRLRLNDAPAIAGLPWELLYDARSNSFLAQSERTPVVRFLDVPQVPRPMTVDGPLRVLAVISAPTDLEELDVEAEWRRIRDAMKPRIEAGLVVLDRLPSATLGELGDWLRLHPTHVIHFVGHGDFDARLREGVIYFQDNHGKSSPVTSSILGPFVRDHDPLRMVVLNACRSARSDAVDPFAGMAQGLVQQDATAVVAMQFPISDRAAVTFTGEFYGALVEGLPVDQAVSSARKALLAEFRDEWATPVLFMRSPDGNIFENVHAVTGVVPVGPDEVRPDPPGPSFWKSLVLFVSRRGKLVVATVVGVLALISILLVVPRLWGGDGGDGADDGRDDATEQRLPEGAPLTTDQLLVAAGERKDELDIYVMDVNTGQVGTQAVTEGDRTKDWLPVLSPDRETLIYSRERQGPHQLRTAAAIDGRDDRPLFDDSASSVCGRSTNRPAWLPDVDELVVRCWGTDGIVRLVRIDVSGGFVKTYEKVEPGRLMRQFNDPTVSSDGITLVYYASKTSGSKDGILFRLDMETLERFVLLDETDEFAAYSDPVFSPDGEMLAWRATVKTPEGTLPSEAPGFEVLAARIDNGELDTDNIIRISGMVPGIDQDPMFSPQGDRIIWGHSPRDDLSTPEFEPDVVQELWIASVDDPTDREKLSTDQHRYYAVPAWSRR